MRWRPRWHGFRGSAGNASKAGAVRARSAHRYRADTSHRRPPARCRAPFRKEIRQIRQPGRKTLGEHAGGPDEARSVLSSLGAIEILDADDRGNRLAAPGESEALTAVRTTRELGER